MRPLEWRWVSSKNNAADDATRYVPSALKNDSRWFLGPEFLYEHENKWPNKVIYLQTEVDPEEVTVNLTTQGTPLVDFKRFSSLRRLTNAVARVLEAKNRWLKQSPYTSYVDKLLCVEQLCAKVSQQNSFSEKINDIKNCGHVKRSSRILFLTPYIDKNGILRSNSRIQGFDCDNFPTDPIILDLNDKYSFLLIKQYHEKFFHRGHETVVNELRQKFWIIGLREKLRSIVAHCSICKYLRGSPVQPRLANIPKVRLGHRLRVPPHPIRVDTVRKRR